jgi:hypothetical protein
LKVFVHDQNMILDGIYSPSYLSKKL